VSTNSTTLAAGRGIALRQAARRHERAGGGQRGGVGAAAELGERAVAAELGLHAVLAHDGDLRERVLREPAAMVAGIVASCALATGIVASSALATTVSSVGFELTRFDDSVSGIVRRGFR
jgi:hypothetical protein